MFKKFRRLTRRDIQFLLRRGQKCYGKTFVFSVSRRTWGQTRWSVQIPTKVDKRAVMRNFLKRATLDIIKSQEEKILADVKHPVNIFVMINKKAVPELTKLIASSDKTTILTTWNDLCKEDFNVLQRKIGVLLSPGPKAGRTGSTRR